MARNSSPWLAAADKLDDFRSTPELPTATDVIVIGAGIAGCAAALRCGRAGRACVLLDSGGVAGGATGRNGGHLWPAGGGRSTARGFYEESAVERLRGLVRELGGEEAFEVCFPGSIELAVTEEQAETIKSGAGEFWDAARVRAEYQSAPGKFCGGMFHAAGGMLHPVRVTRALASAAVAEGVNLQTHCMVTQIGGCDGGHGAVQVVTERGVVRATMAVIVCVNAWTSALLPELEGVVVPHINHVLVTEPLPICWKHPFTADDDCWYGMQRPDGRIVIGGAPLPAPNSRALTDHSPCISERGVRALRRWVADHFPAVSPENGVQVEAEWAGYLTETADHLPLVGRLRDKVWVCGGFNGHGMPVGAAMGADCADLALAAQEASDDAYLSQLAPARLLGKAAARVHSNVSGDPTGAERQNTCVWDHFVWDTLPPNLKSKWEELGWSGASFDGHADEPSTESKTWMEMNEQQRAAAAALGYTRDAWDAGDEPWELPAGVSERDEETGGNEAGGLSRGDSADTSEGKPVVQAERALKDFRSLRDKDAHFPPRRPVLGVGTGSGTGVARHAQPAASAPDAASALPRTVHEQAGDRGGSSLGLAGSLPPIAGGVGGGMMKKSSRTKAAQMSFEQELDALMDEMCEERAAARVGDRQGAGQGTGSRGFSLFESALRPSLDSPLPPFEPAIGGVLDEKVKRQDASRGSGSARSPLAES